MDVSDGARLRRKQRRPKMSGITTRFIARIRQNLELWRAGEIDHATFTDGQRDAWKAIQAAGKRVEAEVIAALHGGVLLADVGLLDDNDYRTVQLPTLRRLPAQRDGYRGDLGRTVSGNPILRIAAVDLRSPNAEHRQLTALIYEIAAHMERCSQQLEVHWSIAPDVDNGQVVIELSGDHESALANELVANVMSQHGLRPLESAGPHPAAARRNAAE
jgi:hypothetical protein